MSNPKFEKLQRTNPILVRPNSGVLGSLERLPLILPPINVVRPEDLFVARFSFVNLTYAVRDDRWVLLRRVTSNPAYLVMDLQPQHIVEQAFLETSGSSSSPKKQTQPDGTVVESTPDVGESVPAGPVQARIATHTRLVFVVTDEQIPATLEGLLRAAATLPLSVSDRAKPRPLRRGRIFERLDPDVMVSRRFLTVQSRVSAGVAVANALRAESHLAARIGVRDASDAVSALGIARELGISQVLKPERERVRIKLAPRQPQSHETSIELPWRLKLSPTTGEGFDHTAAPVTHQGRTELWHSRLEPDPAGGDRIVRAVWARDFDQFGFKARPTTAADFPNADGSVDNPGFRKSLNSRDRMMLVHESTNYTLRRGTQSWEPEAADVDLMLLSSLGGWLGSEFKAPVLPDGPFSITEWKHNATMARDHEVKVVYAGFLFPFGHQASLVKVTERKFHPALPGNPAALRQRFFLVVRKQTLTYASTQSILDARNYGPVKGAKRLNLVMPLASLSVLTRVTPVLDGITNLVQSGGLVFVPRVDGSPYLFKIVATDRGGHVQEFSAPLMWVERDHNIVTGGSVDHVIKTYWDLAASDRRMSLGSQKVRFAPAVSPVGESLDTDLDVTSLFFDALPLNDSVAQDDPRFYPVLRDAEVVVPSMSMLAGANTPVTVNYPALYAQQGYSANASNVFLAVSNKPKLDFSTQGDKSGGFVTPNLAITGLSGSSGPVGGELTKAMAGTLSPQDLFQGISAKLFGIIPLSDLLGAVPLTPDKFPKFVGETIDRVVSLLKDLQRVVELANLVEDRFGAEPDASVQAARSQLNGIVAEVEALITAITSFNPTVDVGAKVTAVALKLGALAGALETATPLPAALRNDAIVTVRRISDQVSNVAELVGSVNQFAKGISLPPVVSARLHWSTKFYAWPSGAAVFQPKAPGSGGNVDAATLDLAVELQAPVKADQAPTALISCSLTPFALQLIGDDPFIALKIEKMEFLLAQGGKPDVNVVFADGGVEFGGPLRFVETLRELIPFNGFSDPPYLDVSPEGIKAGFDLALPDLTIGVMSLANVTLGANLRVPFIDDSLDFSFNFCTREHPFRLTVWLFGGGGFFGFTVTPEKCLVLEAAFEFGAAVALNFGVASGSIECMAGIYFRLSEGNSELTGYFRLRGEVDVLGLISACIELYLELSYEFASGKAVGRASLSIEVEIAFLSFSVSITCEKKFKGSNGDPSFAEVMGPAALGATRPWDEYCSAFSY